MKPNKKFRLLVNENPIKQSINQRLRRPLRKQPPTLSLPHHFLDARPKLHVADLQNALASVSPVPRCHELIQVCERLILRDRWRWR
jgi:hypothetical protein